MLSIYVLAFEVGRERGVRFLVGLRPTQLRPDKYTILIRIHPTHTRYSCCRSTSSLFRLVQTSKMESQGDPINIDNLVFLFNRSVKAIEDWSKQGLDSEIVPKSRNSIPGAISEECAVMRHRPSRIVDGMAKNARLAILDQQVDLLARQNAIESSERALQAKQEDILRRESEVGQKERDIAYREGKVEAEEDAVRRERITISELREEISRRRSDIEELKSVHRGLFASLARERESTLSAASIERSELGQGSRQKHNTITKQQRGVSRVATHQRAPCRPSGSIWRAMPRPCARRFARPKARRHIKA